MSAQVVKALLIALWPIVLKGLKAAWFAFIAYLIANSQVIRDAAQSTVPGPVGTGLEYVLGLLLSQAAFKVGPAPKKKDGDVIEAQKVEDKDYS